MTDTKKRVSSLAKTHEISSDLLLKLLKDAGVDVKSSSSMIDQEGFTKVKPLLAAEKERQEREALIKSGKKIPMKAVLKKAPPPPPPAPKPVVPEPAPEVPEPAPEVLKPAAMDLSPVEIAPARPEPPAEAEEAPPAEPAPRKSPPPPPISSPADAESKARSLHAELKVSVEKPDANLLARIAKSRAESSARNRGRDEQRQDIPAV